MKDFDDYDDNEFNAFVLDECREPDEHSPEAVFGFDDESVHPYFGNIDL